MFLRNGVDFQLHGVISQKIEFFIPTAVRTSNPTSTAGACEQVVEENIWTEER
jgi:hypothetical protein